MAEEKNSIFDLADKFGVESPFDDWLKKEDTQDNPWDAMILSIEAGPNYQQEGSSQITPKLTVPPNSIFSHGNVRTDNPDYVVVSLTIRVYIQNKADQVRVKLKGKSPKIARRNFLNDSLYEVNFKVKVEKSKASIDQYNVQTFIFTGEVYDLYTKSKSDAKSLQISVDTIGNITNSSFVRPIQQVEFHIYSDGKLREWTPDKIPSEYEKRVKYIYHEQSGKEHDIGDFTVKTIKNIYGSFYGGKTVDLVDIRDLNNYISDTVYFRLSINSNRLYMNKRTLGSLLGAMLECSYNDFVYNGFSNERGESIGGSTSHKNGQNGDFRYLRKDLSGQRMDLFKESETGDPCGWKGLDEERQNKFNDALYKFGWKSMLSQYYNENNILNHCTNDNKKNHNDHLHVQGYKPDYQKIKKNVVVLSK